MSGVSESSKLVRSVIKPLLHPLEQIGGGVGWRASVGSGGRLAWGVAAGGLGGGEGEAQALTSSTGSSQIGAQVLGFLAGMGDFLFNDSGAAVFFSAGGLDGHAGLAVPVDALTLQLGDGGLMGGALVGQAHSLQAQQGGQGQHSGDQDAGGHGAAFSAQGMMLMSTQRRSLGSRKKRLQARRPCGFRV